MVGAVLASMVLGFLAGLWAFKVRSRWCPRCGDWTLPQPPNGDDERLVRKVVEANDPARHTPVDPPSTPGAELCQWVDRA